MHAQDIYGRSVPSWIEIQHFSVIWGRAVSACASTGLGTLVFNLFMQLTTQEDFNELSLPKTVSCP